MVCFLATIPSIQVRIKASKASCHISTSRTQVTIMHSHRPSTYSYQCRFTQMSAQALLCPRMRLAALYCYGNTLLLQSLYEGGRSWEGEKDNQTVGFAMAEDCLIAILLSSRARLADSIQPLWKLLRWRRQQRCR